MSKATDAVVGRSLRSARTADQHLAVAAKALSDDEQELLEEWVAACSDIAAAYVSRRKADDPVFHGRIVVIDQTTRKPCYLLYCSTETDRWTVTSFIEQTEIGEFPTLHAALSFVRPVRILHPIAALKAG